MMRIVVLDGHLLNPGDVSWDPLNNLGELLAYDFTPPEYFAQRARGAEVVLVNKTEVRKSNIPQLSACALVGVLATGANNLDLDDMARAGIKVCNVPGYGVDDVAQHALALLLELARGTGAHTASVKAGDWQKSGQWCYWLKPPLSLSGLTIGIVGFGSIGQAMGRMARALGMNVLAWSRSRSAKVDYPFEYVSLEDLWRGSNVISLHCPLAQETREIVNEESIDKMPDGAIIINTARGGLVAEKAVADALVSGKLAGFGADVLSSEPPHPDNPLLEAPNTLLTPHMAWATKRARQKIIDIMAANISAFFAGEPQNTIN